MGLQDIINKQSQNQLDKERKEREEAAAAEAAQKAAASDVKPHLLRDNSQKLLDDYVVAQILLSRVVPYDDDGYMLGRFAKSLGISNTRLKEYQEKASRLDDNAQAALINSVVESLGEFAIQAIFVFDFLRIHGEHYALDGAIRDFWFQICKGILHLDDALMASFEELCSAVAENNPFVELENRTCGIQPSVLKYYLPQKQFFERQYIAIDLSAWKLTYHSEWSLQTALANGTSTLWLRYISPGAFKRGAYQVSLTKGFYMGVFPVTQRQWELVMGNNPSNFKNARLSAPVECVSYDDICNSFLGRIRQRSGLVGLDLPTEAQWEYACRAGTTGERYGNLDAIAWYNGNSNNTTHGVGQKRPNTWGMYDMLGNVWEWCRDRYGDYPKSDVKDPVGASSGSDRVLRGGCWGSGADSCFAARRGRDGPSDRSGYLGFRLVLVP